MKFSNKSLLLAGFATALLLSAEAQAGSKVYTLDADFDEGTLFNLNHTAVHNQLQVNETIDITTFPVMYVANAGEDTLSKIDTTTGKETARYRTWFGPSGQNGYVFHLGNAYGSAAPSRTCVDKEGNVYVANRHFDGRPADVVKILAKGGIDRNGNGVINTSTDVNNDGVISGAEILPMSDANNNGIIDPNEIQDERIAWVTRVELPLNPTNNITEGGQLGRSLSIDPDGFIWLGYYFNGHYYKLDPSDGHIILGPITVNNNTPYGSLVDSKGFLWSTSLGSSLAKLDTKLGTYIKTYFHSGADYGMALSSGKVIQALYSGQGPFSVFDPVTETFSYPAVPQDSSLGVATDAAGDIFTASYNGGGTVRKYHINGTQVWASPAQDGGEARGVVVDSNNDVWVIHRTSNKISKFRGTDGAPLGVFPVGDQPYTYTDATGIQQFTQTRPDGTWDVLRDSGHNGTGWGKVSWHGATPGGTTLKVEYRAADTTGALAGKSFVTAANGADFCGGNIVGRYLEVKATLSRVDANTAVLYDLTVEYCDTFPPVADCSSVITSAGKIMTLKATDDSDANPKIYLKDSVTSYTAGPFKNNDKIIFRQNAAQAPYSKAATGAYVARVQFKNAPLIWAEDSKGNKSTPIPCQ